MVSVHALATVQVETRKTTNRERFIEQDTEQHTRKNTQEVFVAFFICNVLQTATRELTNGLRSVFPRWSSWSWFIGSQRSR